MNPEKESVKILLDNFRAYIQMYREWGLEGVNVKLPDAVSVGAYGRTPLQKNAPEIGRNDVGATHASPLPTAVQPTIHSKTSLLSALRAEIGDCTRCKLHTGRRQLVFGSGNPEAELMFVGEAPGEDEDRQGEPFVGKAGQLLTRIIRAMGLPREEVYIANIIKCRPPKNRNPEPDEIETCSPFLRRQIETIRPKVICALGNFAAQTLLATGQKISQLRGRFHALPPSFSDGAAAGIKVMPTFHPAYLLRNPEDKKRVWEDMQMIMRELNLAGRVAGGGAPHPPATTQPGDLQ
ncbi:MAG TPA: uracil-DNA glycosylase [Nitrospiria bacterium]|nr:uracil-DNA glycosylase [Nitrospiria bacterium]